ncbi:MAG: hypothetical protein KF684_08560 [Phycisphaeraceae bacterium]|nr:hypothetical protein [Phycisphaeraceae bacterium]
MNTSTSTHDGGDRDDERRAHPFDKRLPPDAKFVDMYEVGPFTVRLFSQDTGTYFYYYILVSHGLLSDREAWLFTENDLPELIEALTAASALTVYLNGHLNIGALTSQIVRCRVDERHYLYRSDPPSEPSLPGRTGRSRRPS